VFDQRGFNTFIHNQAAEFLEPEDKRLLLNRIVEKISWNENSTTTYMTDGSCIDADYIINTFSLGVLRSGNVTFSPALPQWKQDAINAFQFGTFTKIFLQFPPEKVFWDRSTEFFLYASPMTRGHYPVWQSLDHPSFLPGSGILMTTVVAEQAYAVEAQDNETTKNQVLKVLREMFGENSVPEPIDFMYPRWSRIPWSYGSFSNWPPGMKISEHENLKANTGRMVFAGEATSTKYYGYLHGAYFEGKAAGDDIAACIKDFRNPSCQIQTTRPNIISSNF
jgi:polyamine oxidase